MPSIPRIADGLSVGRLRSRSGAKWQVPDRDVLPAWVADMDFPVAEPIVGELRQLVQFGDLGYPDWPDGRTPLRDAFADRMADRFSWSADPDRVREFTDVSQGVQAVLHLATEPGDGVAVHTPVFGPFRSSILGTDRRLVPIPMLDTPGGWTFDLERFADTVASTRSRVLLLVNPHNPTGRVFRRDELRGLAEVAEQFGLLVVSDEIHADLAYPGHEHVPFASLGDEVEARTVTLTSASKAFNIAGIRSAVGHLGPEDLRAEFDALPGALLGSVGLAGVRATLAAWNEADAWLEGAIHQLDRNRRLVADVLSQRLPGVRHHLPEATYLSWLDCRPLGWGPDPAAAFRRLSKIELSPGPNFNPGGDGFGRLNFATSTPLLEQILDRMVDGADRARYAA